VEEQVEDLQQQEHLITEVEVEPEVIELLFQVEVN
jgi:hypothetical protein